VQDYESTLENSYFPSTGNTEIFVSLHKNVYHALNYYRVVFIDIVSFLYLRKKD